MRIRRVKIFANRNINVFLIHFVLTRTMCITTLNTPNAQFVSIKNIDLYNDMPAWDAIRLKQGCLACYLPYNANCFKLRFLVQINTSVGLLLTTTPTES